MCDSEPLIKQGSRLLLSLVAAALIGCAGPRPPRIPLAAQQAYRAASQMEQAGKVAHAHERYATAVGLAPEYPDAQLGLLRTTAKLSGPGVATTYAQQVHDNPATRPEGLLLLAMLATEERRKIALLETALDQRPSLHQAAYQLGLIYRRAERFAEALDRFEEVLALDPRHVSAREQASYCLFRLFRWHEALYQAHQALRIDDRARRARIFLAVDRLIKRDYAGAVAHYRKLTQHHPGYRLSQEEQGIFLMAYRGALSRHRIARRLDAGRRLAVEAVKAFPRSGMAHDFLGYFSGDSLADYRTALKQDPYRLQTVQDMRRALIRDGRHREAFEIWRRIVPYRLVMREDNALRERWLRVAQRLTAARPDDDAETRAELARALRDVGWLDEAVICFEQAEGKADGALAERLAAERSRAAAVRGFLHELHLKIRGHYRKLERAHGGLSLGELRDWIAQKWPGQPAPDLDRDLQRWFVFVREANPFRVRPGSLAEALARYNLIFDVGDNNGYLDMRVSKQLFRQRMQHRVGRLAYPYTVLVTDETIVDNYLGYLSGTPRISGRAFLSRQGFYVAIDTIRPSRRSLLGFLAEPPRLPAASEQGGYHRGLDIALRRRFLKRFDIDYPLVRPTPEQLDAAFSAYVTGFSHNVWLHELGHLVDFENYVPLAAHLGSNIWVALRSGLSPAAIELRFEQMAETFSLATTRFPYLSIHDNLDRLLLNPDSLFYMVLVAWQKKDPRESPYYKGAQRILQDLLDGAGVSDPQELAEVPDEKVRALARALCREEGFPFGD